MGIYDREYIRGESPGTGLFGGVSPVTKSIIAISVGTFLLQNLLFHDNNATTLEWLAASPDRTFRGFRLFQLVTASFVNFSPWSLLFDMYFLWIIGREMESIYGSRDFLVFYVASAVVTTLAGLAVAASAGLMEVPVFGPWGAVVAVMTLYTLFYPKQEILFFFFIPMPMWLLLAIYILIPVLGHFSHRSPGIDAGIALAGAGYAYAFKQFDLRWSRLASGRRFRPRLRIVSSSGYEKARPRGWSPSRTTTSVGGGGRAPAVSVLPEEQLDARVDARYSPRSPAMGIESSLTGRREEQRILQEASRRAPGSVGAIESDARLAHRTTAGPPRAIRPTCRSSSISSTARSQSRPNRRSSIRRSSRRAWPAPWPTPTAFAPGSPNSTERRDPWARPPSPASGAIGDGAGSGGSRAST